MSFQHSSAPFHHFKASHGTHENNQGHVRCTWGACLDLWLCRYAMTCTWTIQPPKNIQPKTPPKMPNKKKHTHVSVWFFFFGCRFSCAPKPRRHPSTLIWCDVTKLTSHPRSSPVAVGCSQPALVSSLKGQKCRDAPPPKEKQLLQIPRKNNKILEL